VSKSDQSNGPTVAGRKGSKTKPVERQCQPDASGCDIGAREICVLSASLRSSPPNSEGVTLRHPVMPVGDGLSGGIVGIHDSEL